MIKKVIAALFVLVFLPLASLAAGIQPIPVNQAFVFSAQSGLNHALVADWTIAPGYHLYRDRIKITLIKPKTAQLADYILPAGKEKSDSELGTYQVYSNKLHLLVPIINAADETVTLQVNYQGCADDGFCYPPISKIVALKVDKPGNQAKITEATTPVQVAPVKTQLYGSTTKSEQSQASDLLASHNWWAILLGFLGFGLLLSFTPCVLPMIPILSGIIAGHGNKMTTGKAFALSCVYVLSMSTAYALFGVLAALAGRSLQAFFQSPWVLGAFSVIFVLLALALFGFFQLHLPAKFQEKIAHVSNRQQGGTYLGVMAMGFLATLIVSPCVTAPLVGALSYISSTGNALLGGSALFVMSLGMGIPLIIIGTFGGKVLPKVGPWMNVVQRIFGVLFLAVAIWLLQRMLPGQISLLLWAALAIGSAIFMGALNLHVQNNWQRFWQSLGVILLIYGITMVVGASMGNSNPLQPLKSIQGALNAPITAAPQQGLNFKKVKSISDLQQALANAKQQNKPVMLDFYADWCISCQEIEHTIFNNPTVHQLLSHYQLLQADVTANDAQDKALEKYTGVYAPPTIIFYGTDGLEIANSRLVGDISLANFLKHVQSLPAK